MAATQAQEAVKLYGMRFAPMAPRSAFIKAPMLSRMSAPKVCASLASKGIAAELAVGWETELVGGPKRINP